MNEVHAEKKSARNGDAWKDAAISGLCAAGAAAIFFAMLHFNGQGASSPTDQDIYNGNLWKLLPESCSRTKLLHHYFRFGVITAAVGLGLGIFARLGQSQLRRALRPIGLLLVVASLMVPLGLAFTQVRPIDECLTSVNGPGAKLLGEAH